MKDNWRRHTALFLTSQSISLFGSMLVQYAITWHITLSTKSGTMMTIAIICGFLPTFFLSPFAGVWADRYNRKTLIILSDSTIALSTLILAILFYIGYDAVWLLFVVSVIRGFGAGVQTPAVSALLPQLVPGDKLTRVNGINTSIQSMLAIVAPMLSGVLLSVAEIESIFFIDVATAAIAVSILLSLSLPVHAKALSRQETSYYHDMLEGYRYIRGHEYVKAFFVFCAVFFVLIAPAAFLTPLQVTRTFGSDVWRLTAIEIAFSSGMLVGGIIMASWKGFKNRVHTMVLATFVLGLCTFLIGIVPVFWIYLFFMWITGLTIPAFNVPATVMLQQKVEEEFLGRVFGVLGMISSIMMPMGMLVFGPAADFVKIELLLVGTGLLLVVHSLFLIGNKVLIEAGKPAPKPNVPEGAPK